MRHREKLTEVIKREAAKYIAENANRSPLITVTDAIMPSKTEKIKILVTVYPVEKEEPALEFLERHRRDLYATLKERIRARALPDIKFGIDGGEKNRQRIDQISANM
ncbi:MAG: Ribosome-binding factor A [Parcubacteria group bacterium GW2011_GWA2_47_21]|nr:MAG: Ribosome-binding factor A [Parcubacteria group bacterium GW2011_GWA2_47_21]